jgi:Tfp pilus assembly protein PilF
MRLRGFLLGFALLSAVDGTARARVAAGQSANASKNTSKHTSNARASLAAAYLAERRDSVDAHIADAVRHARLAVAATPDDADAHYWLAAALGRRARRSGFAGAVRAGRESYLEARHALRLDSLHGGAHAVVGGFHEAVARLRWPVRTMVTALVALPDVRQASLASAEREYRTAVRVDPTSLQFRNDLGGFLARSGRLADAEAEWRAASDLPALAPVDHWLRQDLRRRINEAARRP